MQLTSVIFACAAASAAAAGSELPTFSAADALLDDDSDLDDVDDLLTKHTRP